METVKFSPDKENIKKRQNIKPYGDLSGYVSPEKSALPFVYDKGTEVAITPQKEAVDKSAKEYIPKTHEKMMNGFTTSEVNIRISNLPESIKTSNELEQILKRHIAERQHGCTSKHQRCYLVIDRNTSKSKGFAYLTFPDEKTAKEFARQTSNLVIESLKICVEVLSNK